jgi:hypothetical protein
MHTGMSVVQQISDVATGQGQLNIAKIFCTMGSHTNRKVKSLDPPK